MNSFFIYILIVGSYYIYTNTNLHLKGLVIKNSAHYLEFYSNYIIPSFFKNPFFYLWCVIKIYLLIYQRFLTRISFYRETLLSYLPIKYGEFLRNEIPLSIWNLKKINKIPVFQPVNFKELSKNREKEFLQMEKDLEYIVQIEQAVLMLKTLEQLVLILMVCYWLGSATLLNKFKQL